MPKRGENITKRKDGRYEARFVKERDEYGRIKKYGFVYAKSYLEVKKIALFTAFVMFYITNCIILGIDKEYIQINKKVIK